MTRRTDRRAACCRPNPVGSAACAVELRSEMRALRHRIEALWSSALLGQPLVAEDVHGIALTLSTLRLQVEAMAPARAGEPAGSDVAAARDDVACCVVAVGDLVAYFAAV